MSTGIRQDTLAGDSVHILVPSEGPYGVVFTCDNEGHAAVVREFIRLPDGRFGPIQKHGGIHVGDVLYEINDNSLMNLPHQDVIKMIQDTNMLKKNFKFLNNKEYYHQKRNKNTKSLNVELKNNFLSTIKRTRVSEDTNGKKYIEYEVGCQLRMASTKIKKENIYQWGVWKRFSEFEQLNTILKKTLGWQMNGIEFPSAHRFSFNKLAPEFVAQRHNDLKDYWSKLMSIDKISDFHKAHHCSLDLRDFLEVEANTTQKQVALAPDMIEDANTSSLAITNGEAPPAPSTPTNAAVTGSRRNSLKMSNRRISGQYNPSRASTNMSSSSSSASTPALPPSESRPPPASSSPQPASTTPPPPPARPSAPAPAPVAAPAPTPAPAPAPAASLPPPPTGPRAALFASINSRRID